MRQIFGQVLRDLLAPGHSAHQQHKPWKGSSPQGEESLMGNLYFPREADALKIREIREATPACYLLCSISV